MARSAGAVAGTHCWQRITLCRRCQNATADAIAGGESARCATAGRNLACGIPHHRTSAGGTHAAAKPSCAVRAGDRSACFLGANSGFARGASTRGRATHCGVGTATCCGVGCGSAPCSAIASGRSTSCTRVPYHVTRREARGGSTARRICASSRSRSPSIASCRALTCQCCRNTAGGRGSCAADQPHFSAAAITSAARGAEGCGRPNGCTPTGGQCASCGRSRSHPVYQASACSRAACGAAGGGNSARHAFAAGRSSRHAGGHRHFISSAATGNSAARCAHGGGDSCCCTTAGGDATCSAIAGVGSGRCADCCSIPPAIANGSAARRAYTCNSTCCTIAGGHSAPCARGGLHASATAIACGSAAGCACDRCKPSGHTAAGVHSIRCAAIHSWSIDRCLAHGKPACGTDVHPRYPCCSSLRGSSACCPRPHGAAACGDSANCSRTPGGAVEAVAGSAAPSH